MARMKHAGKKIGIIIADDHAVLRESLAALLGSQPDFRVLGSAVNGADALEMVQKQHTDVLLLDLFMPGTDGFEVLRTLDRAGTRVAAVVLTGSENQADYVQVVRLGARGLVLKGDPPDTLFGAIRAVAGGELAFSNDIAHQVLTSMVSDSRREASSIQRLSDRERQIAALVAQGLKNKDIGLQLHISENTVKRHLQSIFNKTGAHDRLELAVLALSDVSRAA